ncbi:metal-dependent hydrolase [Zobellella endophytica]|uniref:Metal-dependent hydrolase n=1 Tax=Zobellella endophytica TaxID=2116700 RepID=A0A2P7R5Z0_9GAMM|nr:metal-dependent hydrolase [Zobellella endophytica]PSJ45629.1 metal-dependent hydrolase [Zobellella endophytica]
MDSISQLALGAAVGVAVMGRRAGTGKAVLAGAVFGTLPDLDVFIDYGDPVSNMTFHRGWSHSLFYLTLLSPVFAWLLSRLPGQAPWRGRWTLTLWLVLITHVLLDNMTVYGTQLGLPFTDFPFGFGSIFIIDPLYTLPLLAGLAGALLRRGAKGLGWNRLGLWLSTLYLGWTLVAQWQVSHRVDQSLAEQGVQVERRLVTPTAFNTLLWRILVITPSGYLEGFYSLLDGERAPVFTRYERGEELYRQLQDNWYVARIAWFSRGFFKMSERGGEISITDLRMGQEPGYSFNFVVAERRPAAATGGEPAPVALERPRQFSERLDVQLGLGWLWRRALGEPLAAPGNHLLVAPVNPAEGAG